MIATDFGTSEKLLSITSINVTSSMMDDTDAEKELERTF